jgi:hypothetical protein
LEEKQGDLIRDDKGREKLVQRLRALEGPNTMPKYKDKLPEAYKNINSTRHLLKGDQKLSTVIWEAGLRS